MHYHLHSIFKGERTTYDRDACNLNRSCLRKTLPMMMIQVILSSLLMLLLLYAVGQFHRSRPISILIVVCCVIGIVFVIFPRFSTDIANLLGVGRGADLVLYLLAVVTLAAICNLHLRIRASHETVTDIARAMAIISARKPSCDQQNASWTSPRSASLR